MTTVEEILEDLKQFEEDPESRGVQLRLNLAEIVIRSLRAKGWTQRQLADEAGMKESYVSRVLHSAANCTFDSAGKLLFALDVSASIMESSETQEVTTDDSSEGGTFLVLMDQEFADGEEIEESSSTTEEATINLSRCSAGAA